MVQLRFFHPQVMALYQVFFLFLLMGKNGEFLSTIIQSHLFMGCIWKALILCIGGSQRSSARREGSQEIPVLCCFNKHWSGRTNMLWWWAHVRFLSFPECIVVIYFFFNFFCAGLCQVGGGCTKISVNSCSDCIQSGPECAWCMQEASVTHTSSSSRWLQPLYRSIYRMVTIPNK